MDYMLIQDNIRNKGKILKNCKTIMDSSNSKDRNNNNGLFALAMIENNKEKTTFKEEKKFSSDEILESLLKL